MRATINGFRLPKDWRTGLIGNGAKSSILVPSAPKVVWNGNPFCKPGTVLYLPGLPGSGDTIYDYSGQGNDATRTGATWKQLPSGLMYLSLDGDNDLLTVTDHASITPGTQDWSIAIWAKITANPGREALLATLDTTSGYYWDILADGTMRGSFQRIVSHYVYIDSSVAVDDSIWHLLGFTWDFSAKTLLLLVDGVDKSTGGGASGTVSTVPNDMDLKIGYRNATQPYLQCDVALHEMQPVLLAPAWYLEKKNRERHLFGV